MTSERPHPSHFICVRTCCPPTETPSHLYHFLKLPNAWRMETIGYSLVLVQSALKRVKPPKFAWGDCQGPTFVRSTCNRYLADYKKRYLKTIHNLNFTITRWSEWKSSSPACLRPAGCAAHNFQNPAAVRRRRCCCCSFPLVPGRRLPLAGSWRN